MNCTEFGQALHIWWKHLYSCPAVWRFARVVLRMSFLFREMSQKQWKKTVKWRTEGGWGENERLVYVNLKCSWNRTYLSTHTFKTIRLILEHFLLQFSSEMFLTGFGKQRKKKTSAKFMNAWKCVPTQQKFSELCSPGRVFLSWKRVLVLLNLHTYTPRQLLIRARNSSDVCSQNRHN